MIENLPDTNVGNIEYIRKQEAIDIVEFECGEWSGLARTIVEAIEQLPPVQPDLGKYEYHYDHTDCIWYRPDARNRCPATCAQYRDGEGYRPFRRDKKYEG